MKKKETTQPCFVLGFFFRFYNLNTWYETRVPKSSCCENYNQRNRSSDSCSQKPPPRAFFPITREGRRIQVPHLTGRNPITFPFSTSATTPAPHSQSLIPTQTLTSPPDYCSLPGWDSRYLLASHSTHRTHSWSAKNPQRLLEDVIKLQTLEFFLRGSNSTLFSMVSQSITLL